MHKNYLAIDIGASSGRHIVGWMENGVLRTEEVYRFPNSVQRVDGHLEWDIDSLFANVKQGIREAFAKYPVIESLSIDTWAVDYVLLKDGKPLSPVYAYRDSRTQAVIPEVHSILPFAQLYQRTGIQFQPFNSIYQLYADKKAGRLAQAEDFLMIPEYLLWKLCGVKAREYTNATSTGLVNSGYAHLWDGIDDPFLYLKLTRHNGRAGTHGTYNPKHNDRSFNLANSEHIDSERAKGNIYWDCFHGFRSALDPQDPDDLAATFSDVERQFYETHYTAFVESQNERNAKIRHTERNRSIPDLLSSRKTCPEETIYQLGTLDEHASAEDLISHLYRPALGRSHDDLQQRRLQVGVQPCHAGNAASPSAGLYAGGCTGWHDLRLSGGLHG